MATKLGAVVSALLKIAESVRSLAQASSSSSTDTSGWISYSSVIPTRASADDPTYVLTFSGVDLTSKISVGMRVKFVQNSATLYGIVTAIVFSTNTTLTLYCGTDYDVLDTATYAISGFAYSSHKAPLGFPMDPSKWEITGGSAGLQLSAVQNTWYNKGGSISIPIGSWTVSYDCEITNLAASGDTELLTTLSTGASSESDSGMTSDSYGGTQYLSSGVRREKIISLSSKTTYYLNIKTTRTNTPNIYINVAGAPRIRAVCSYL